MQRFAVFLMILSVFFVTDLPLSQAQELFNRVSKQKTENPLASERDGSSSTDLFVRTTPGTYREKAYRPGGLRTSKKTKGVNIPSTWHTLAPDVLENRLADTDRAQALTDKIRSKIAADNRKHMMEMAKSASYDSVRVTSKNFLSSEKPNAETKTVGGNTFINKTKAPKEDGPAQLFNSPTY